MKISDYPEEKINIYSSEMSAETMESYEKYYKNLNESNTDKIQNELHSDSNGILEHNENDLLHDTTTKHNSTVKDIDNINDSDRKRVRISVAETSSDITPNKKRKKEFEPPKLQENNRDIFCWRCHKYVVVGDIIPCYFCPRVFHLKCAHIQEKPSTFWLCTECDAISAAENPDKMPPALSKLQKKDLAELLMFVLKRMRQHEGSSHFENPVDDDSYPDYRDYIVKPMYLSLLEDNVKNLKFSSCESFLADTKWMVHNSYIFNTVHSELTLYAKAMMKNAKHECEEIINCPDCYLHANTLSEDIWFIEPCDKPHVLVWARLKGFPYWPCKVMKANGTTVDVRFFGDHNKSLVPVDCCYLYSKQMPSKQKKVDELEIAIKEAGLHIKKLEERYHVFQYASQKTHYNPKEEEEQRKLLLPYLDKPFFIKVKDKEKLFDPKIVGNFFEEPCIALNRNNACREEDKNKTISDLSNEVEVNNKKNIKNQNDGASSYRPSYIMNRNLSPLNKPKIIIEENDSDILSKGSYSIPRQHSVREFEKLNSSYILNKTRISSTENTSFCSLIQDDNYENGGVPIGIPKTVNLNQRTSNLRSNQFNNNTYQSNCKSKSEENLKSLNFCKDVDLFTEKPTSDKRIISSSDKVITRPLTNLSMDKPNNNVISDKLRISSNAKLINVITDNPSLINNYIFKPMVVIQKLRDEVFRDYSNNYRKTELKVTNKSSECYEDNEEKTSGSGTVGNNELNFDLLNGNITNLVSVTEIDLDKDESSKCDKPYNKEAEKTDEFNVLQSSKCLKSGYRSLKPVIKSENIEDEEQVDIDYIEKLSKSILESSFDYGNDPENELKGNATVENKSCKKISSLEVEGLAYPENETVSNDIASNIKTPVIGDGEVKVSEDIRETFSLQGSGEVNKVINGSSNVNSKLLQVSLINQEFRSLTEKEEASSTLLEQNATLNEKEDTISSHENRDEIKSNEVKNNVINNLFEKDENHIQEIEMTSVDDKIDNFNLLKEVANVENNSIVENKEFNILMHDSNCRQKDHVQTSGIKSFNFVNVKDDEILNDNSKVKCLHTRSVLQSEIISNQNCLTAPHMDSDCEIVNIVFPENSRKILKPIGYKRLKTSGGIIKKVLKSGHLLPTSRRRPNLNISLKRTEGHNLSSKSKFNDSSVRLSNKHVKSCSAAYCRSDSSRKTNNLKSIFEKCTNSSTNEIKRIREEEKMMALEIENILSKVEKLDSKVNLLEVLREELTKFEDHCKKKVENYKNSFIEEMDSLYTMEKQRWIQESMSVSENESKMMIDDIKKKQWCILCLNEAKYHCCWSTSYCSEKCQLADWPIHMKACTQYSMRAGDPDLRLSPELKKILKGEQETIRNLRIKDVMDSVADSQSKVIAPTCSPPYNNDCTNSAPYVSNSSSNNAVPSKSTVYVSKHSAMKQVQSLEALERSENAVTKVIANQAVYVSSVTAPASHSKNIIHVPKQSSTKLNTPNQDHCSGGVVSNNKSILFTVPLSNRNNALVSIGKAITSNNGNTLYSNNQPIMMGGQQFILPKSILPTNIIKKKVPIIAPKDMSCVQENNQLKGKPLYISMSSATREKSESTEELIPNQLDNPKGARILKLEPPKLLKESLEQTSLPNSDITKSAQPFLIVEKSGESSQFTFRIGFQEGLERLQKANILPPLVQRQTVCTVSPLPYPVICDPSPSGEVISTSTTN